MPCPTSYAPKTLIDGSMRPSFVDLLFPVACRRLIQTHTRPHFVLTNRRVIYTPKSGLTSESTGDSSGRSEWQQTRQFKLKRFQIAMHCNKKLQHFLPMLENSKTYARLIFLNRGQQNFTLCAEAFGEAVDNFGRAFFAQFLAHLLTADRGLFPQHLLCANSMSTKHFYHLRTLIAAFNKQQSQILNIYISYYLTAPSGVFRIAPPLSTSA